MLIDVQHWIQHYGYFAIFFMLCFGIVGVPIPDETMLTYAGYLAFVGTLSLGPTLGVAFVGTSLGVTSSYLLGLFFGKWLIDHHAKRIHFDRARADRIERWFERIGKWTLTFGYFVPGVRHITALLAGTAKMPYRLFALYAYPGGLAWSWGFILLGYFLGKRWKDASEQVRHAIFHGLLAAAIVGIVAYALYRLAKWRRQRSQPPPPQERV